MPGGKRPNAGRKVTRPPVERRVMLELSSGETEALERLQRKLGLSAAEVLRTALVSLYGAECR